MRIAKQNKNKFRVFFDKIEVTPDVFNEDVDVRILVRSSLGEYWINNDEELAELMRKVKENDFEVFSNIFIYPAKSTNFKAKVESSTKISGSLF